MSKRAGVAYGDVPGWPDDLVDAHNAFIDALDRVIEAGAGVIDFEAMRGLLLMATSELEHRQHLARKYAPFPVP